jgi:hypothetical protein
MTDLLSHTYTSFDGYRRIACGSLAANALVVKKAFESGAAGPVLIFDDTTGRSVDVDTRGSDEDVVTRLAAAVASDERIEPSRAELSAAPVPESSDSPAAPEEPRGRGRPKLGVVAREVTLLPRHWEWLAAQPGGASVVLRKLVEQARKTSGDKEQIRKAQERTYHFILAIAGDLPGFEEATRALFANDPQKFSALMAEWPGDVREHATRLALGDGLLGHTNAD